MDAALPKESDGHPESVEIQVRLLGDRLVQAYRNRPGGGQYERWAVMPFTNLGPEAEKHKLGHVVAEQLQGWLQSNRGFVCVERMRLNEVVNELKLGTSGLIDDNTAHQVGELAGADAMVVGSVALIGDHYVVSARVVSVEQGKVLASAEVPINAAGLIALSADAVVLRTRSDAVFRSALIPGWGQWYNRQEQKGVFLMVLSGGLLAGGVTFAVLGRVAENNYTKISLSSPGPCQGTAGDGFNQCVLQQRGTISNRYAVANGMFIGLGAVYVYGLLDAFVFGPSSGGSSHPKPVGLDVGPGGLQLHGSF